MFKRPLWGKAVFVLMVAVLCYPLTAQAGVVTVKLSFEEPLDQQSLSGGTTTQTTENQLPTDTPSEIIIEQAGPEEPKTATQIMTSAMDFGASFLFTAPIQVYKIPISYTFKDKYKVGITLPYVYKNLEGRFTDVSLTNSGLGGSYHHSGQPGRRCFNTPGCL